ncbi:MAG: HAMP domain-containing sensor histidine kinase, partial [Vicinamibacterales bacterium]
GWVGVRVVVGRDLATARQRVETEVRTTFTGLATVLSARATPFNRPDVIDAAARGDSSAVRTLFDQAAAANADAGDARAVTMYDSSGQAVAWAGRPADIPVERLTGPESWFLVQGALGVRLALVAPVLTVDGRRVGSVSVEESLNVAPAGPADPGDFVLPTTTPVAITFGFEGAGTVPDPDRFDILDPAGRVLASARIADADLARTARQWTRASVSAALILTSVTLLLLCGPVLAWHHFRRSITGVAQSLGLCALAVIGARALFRLASPADYVSGEVFSGTAYASLLAAPLLSSPFDFLMTALTAGALTALLFTLFESIRTRRLGSRLAVTGMLGAGSYGLTQLIAGVFALMVMITHRALVTDTIANTALDLLQFSLHPWNTARIALQVGLVIWHVTAVALAVLVFRSAVLPWRVPMRGRRQLVTIALWIVPWALWVVRTGTPLTTDVVLLATVLTAACLAALSTRVSARYRHGSQALRVRLAAVAVIVPALAAYPVVFAQVSLAKRYQVETRYAPQAINQRQTIQRVLQDSLIQIDGITALDDLVTSPLSPDDVDAATERAFQIWRSTGLADYPITSSVELFAGDGRLVSRFAFNLPDDLTTTPRADEEQCAWTVYEEVSPFFAEERRVLHAGRAICRPDAAGSITMVGAIVVHAILDYANLPFIASQSPYVELLRPGDQLAGESLSGRDLEYAVYGWSGRPLYSSPGTAWPLGQENLTQISNSRVPVWTTLSRGDARFSVYLQNDRGGIYALGFPVLSALGHLVNLAEVTVLACVAWLLLVVVGLALDVARGRATTGRALLREVRTSFYRKLFLAFVAASVVPVVTLAVLTRTYIADQLRTGVEQEAVRTVAAARRVVEDLVIPRAAGTRETVDDNLMVWVSRLIDQDVNIFRGSRLQATSERNLFASGVLPTRTPADVYRALALRRDATAIITDRVGGLTYLVAATPLATRQFEGMLTVPLTLRQQDIEAQIDTLNRLVLLGALLFILGGAGIGYSMAERIADPVSRLTRATRRIASGELDARIAATSSDELGRLVDDFNRMAADLQSQRTELERTHRLEAWAEMARQVAHEIKNPLTPIQLNAEHIRRVHADRGKPLSPVLDECVANILTQVSILRTIASEFSSFASSPVVRRVPTSLADLVHAIITPYTSALRDKVMFNVDVPQHLPPVVIDRTLLTRAFTNLIENALHAMPAGGTVTVAAADSAGEVVLQVSDTGVGMDSEALTRAFEPYFSTKVTGTGLGLPIAKRNVELSGGTLAIRSTVGQGTTVVLTLPTI